MWKVFHKHRDGHISRETLLSQQLPVADLRRDVTSMSLMGDGRRDVPLCSVRPQNSTCRSDEWRPLSGAVWWRWGGFSSLPESSQGSQINRETHRWLGLFLLGEILKKSWGRIRVAFAIPGKGQTKIRSDGEDLSKSESDLTCLVGSDFEKFLGCQLISKLEVQLAYSSLPDCPTDSWTTVSYNSVDVRNYIYRGILSD